MAKNKNRNQQRTPRPTDEQPPSPDSPRAMERPAGRGSPAPAGMPRRKQPRFGHN